MYVGDGEGSVFLGGKQLLELDPSGKKYICLSNDEIERMELSIKENTILISRSGTIGKINITPKHWKGWIPSDDVIRVIPIDTSMAGYIYAWLSTDYGNELINHFRFGAVITHIDIYQVSQVQIPLLANKDSQKKINDLMLEANQKRYKAYLLEQQAISTVNNLVLNLGFITQVEVLGSPEYRPLKGN